MKRLIIIIFALSTVSCSYSNIITTPLRATSSVVSYIPVVGDSASNVMDASANIIDSVETIVETVTP